MILRPAGFGSLFTYFFKIKYEQLLKKINFYKNDVGKNRDNDIGERCDYVAQIDNSIINLYAIWDKGEYSITYDLDGGHAINKTAYDVEAENFTLENPLKKGYEFTGWTGTNLSD